MKRLNMSVSNEQKGFTLIELVVVIVILGILAVTAAPKFIDLTSDARISAMKGVQGSIESAVSLAQAKALIVGQTGATGVIEISGTFYALVNGYPAADAVGDGTADDKGLGIISLIDLDSGSEIVAVDGATATTATFTYSTAPTPATCVLTYTDAVDDQTRPDIDFSDAGC